MAEEVFDIIVLSCDRTNTVNPIVTIHFNKNLAFQPDLRCDPDGCAVRTIVKLCLAERVGGPVTTKMVSQPSLKFRWEARDRALKITGFQDEDGTEKKLGTAVFPLSEYKSQLQKLVDDIQDCCKCGV